MANTSTFPNLTANEIAMLKAARLSEFGDAYTEQPWVFDVIEKSGLTGRTASGVLGSLVKKELIAIDGKRCGGSYDDDTSLQFTDWGRCTVDFYQITNQRDNNEAVQITAEVLAPEGEPIPAQEEEPTAEVEEHNELEALYEAKKTATCREAKALRAKIRRYKRNHHID